ncbi:DUF742 domain-containing protein [Amycolatopsis sp. NPDC058986]|uniref:DUF742 domain-containing protein n=1 Tax=unclassified Amycolatopsis TaxID=2618356 RepID=UPI00366BD040
MTGVHEPDAERLTLGAAPSLARPYSWTEGRTQPMTDLPVEALVQTTLTGSALSHNSADPRSVVTRLCLRPRSMAEISALMSVPIGVARVLVSDLLGAGLAHLHHTLTENMTWDNRIELIENVLKGLHKL